MTTPASPAPGGGTPPTAEQAPAQTGKGQARAQDPPNILAQGQQVQAGQEAQRDGSDGKGLSADEERQLGELLEKRAQAAGPAPVRLKVDSDHESVTYGGVTVGHEFTEVPAHAVAGLVEGAAAAGVKITQDQES